MPILRYRDYPKIVVICQQPKRVIKANQIADSARRLAKATHKAAYTLTNYQPMRQFPILGYIPNFYFFKPLKKYENTTMIVNLVQSNSKYSYYIGLEWQILVSKNLSF